MSPTSNSRMHPGLDDRRGPLRLSGLTIVLPGFSEAANLPGAVRPAASGSRF